MKKLGSKFKDALMDINLGWHQIVWRLSGCQKFVWERHEVVC